MICERDLRSDVNRLRLYLEDQRTVHILLDHVQDRIVDVYADYRDLVTLMGKASESSRERTYWKKSGFDTSVSQNYTHNRSRKRTI